VRHGVRLVGQRDAAAAIVARVVECRADDALHALARVDVLLDGDLVGVPALKLPPMPTYTPSVFSRKMTRSTSAGVTSFSGDRALSKSWTGRRLM
jgi:predicted YcjX-like family ATPase